MCIYTYIYIYIYIIMIVAFARMPCASFGDYSTKPN